MAAPMGNWQKELELWLEKFKTTGSYDNFRTCGTEEERIDSIDCQQYFNDVQWISAYFEKCHEMHQKSLERASTARQDGNKHFQRKQFKESASKYTKAILLAPHHSQELSLAYGNRSAVLLHLQSFKACLTDIHEAIKQGFPETLKYKLLVRRLHCLKNLGLTEQFQNNITETREAIENRDCDPKQKVKLLKEIKDLEAKANISNEVSEEDTPLPDIPGGRSEVLVQASAAVSMQFNDIQGRFLTANQEVKAGDTLIVEKPFTAVLLPEHYPTHCHHCFVKHEYSFPCRQCSLVRYCSVECATVSWQSYHHIECPYLHLLHSVGIAHLSMRVVLVAGLDFLKEFRHKQTSLSSNQHVPGLDDHGQYCRSYQTVYDLMTHADHMETDDLLQYTMTACLLLQILLHSGWFNIKSQIQHCLSEQNQEESFTDCDQSRSTEDDSLLVKGHFEMCTSCGHAVPGVQVEERHDERLSPEDEKQRNICRCIKVEKESALRTENKFMDGACLKLKEKCNVKDKDKDGQNGCGLNLGKASALEDTEVYIGGLLLRHIQQLVCNAHAITELQCSQSTVGSVVDDLSQVRVATAIYPTASLMNHSCDPSIISSFHKDTLVVKAVKNIPRRGEIFNCYGPHHKRMPFTERQRVLREQYFFTCQCLPCTEGEKAEAVLYSFKCPGCAGPLVPSTPSGYICQECHQQSLTVNTEKAQLATDYFHRAVPLLQENKVKEALQLMKKCCRIRTEVLYTHNKDLSETQDCLARCYAMLGNFKEAAVHLKNSIETVKLVYGDTSIEAANEMQKLSELLISAQSWREALSVIQEAISVFTMHYGKTHDVVKELMAARGHLMDLLGK